MPRSRPICSWVGDLVGLLGLDELGDGLGHHQHCRRCLAPMAVGGLHQHLRYHRQQALRQEALGLFALLHGRASITRSMVFTALVMQRTEHQVAGLAAVISMEIVRHHQLTDKDTSGSSRIAARTPSRARDVRAEFALDDLALLLACTTRSDPEAD